LTIAVYPGSFDPITNGHMDIVRRALALFDKLIVAVYEKPSKRLLFSIEERVDMVQKAVAGISNVCVQSYGCLTVDFIHQVKGKAMIRGLRMNSDFEQEFEMALMNKKLAPDIELVCLMADSGYQFLSSSSIKEVAKLGGCLEGMVPEHVADALGEKFFLRAAKSSTLERR
jgi:pantetheine-phosphate adenylyltransferase